jgi:hypothetical protein
MGFDTENSEGEQQAENHLREEDPRCVPLSQRPGGENLAALMFACARLRPGSGNNPGGVASIPPLPMRVSSLLVDAERTEARVLHQPARGAVAAP